MNAEAEQILSEQLDKRVIVQGVIDKQITNDSFGRNVYRVLMQDMSLFHEGKEFDLGHTWVQEAGSLMAYQSGQRIKFSSRVLQYKQYSGDPYNSTYVRRCGLGYPNEIEIFGELPQQQSESVAESASTVQLLKRVKKLASDCGGYRQLRELIELLD